MASVTAPRETIRGLQSRVTCPHCWEVCRPDQLLWVTEHADLLGDPRLGPDHQQRFLPSRFTVDGDALDARGFPCRSMACPRCHLVVPRPLVEMEPLFLSIIGAPGSGKSFLLGAMTWQLRQVMSSQFALSFSDADPTFNRSLNEYEESLFLNSRADEIQPLAGLIRKTEEQGELYDTVAFGSQTISYPRPFLFAVQPQETHPNAHKVDRLGRVVCLYDNAGESFQPGKDDVGSPVTRHMALSRALFYVFDPTQDARFRRSVQTSTMGEAQADAGRFSRQEQVLQEAAARIRRYTKLRQTEKHNRPLVVVVTKYDVWSHLLEPLLGDNRRQEPWWQATSSENGARLHALDTNRIERMSQMLRLVLQRNCPDIVAAAEGLSREVIYLPVSAVGWSTQVDQRSGLMSIRPEDAQPFWVTIPFLYALHRWTPGLIGGMKRKGVEE